MPDTMKMLEHAKNGVMMHFFSGTNDELAECVERGYYISFTTITCVSKKYRKLAKHTPLDRLLLETDAPWLDPVKKEVKAEDNEKSAKAADYDGNPFLLTNRPWNIALTAQRLEKELHLSAEQILRATEENARRLFGV
jgi:TatD DNase family protein